MQESPRLSGLEMEGIFAFLNLIKGQNTPLQDNSKVKRLDDNRMENQCWLLKIDFNVVDGFNSGRKDCMFSDVEGPEGPSPPLVYKSD